MTTVGRLTGGPLAGILWTRKDAGKPPRPLAGTLRRAVNPRPPISTASRALQSVLRLRNRGVTEVKPCPSYCVGRSTAKGTWGSSSRGVGELRQHPHLGRSEDRPIWRLWRTLGVSQVSWL